MTTIYTNPKDLAAAESKWLENNRLRNGHRRSGVSLSRYSVEVEAFTEDESEISVELPTVRVKSGPSGVPLASPEQIDRFIQQLQDAKAAMLANKDYFIAVGWEH